MSDLVFRIERLLPQIQCRQCGYDGCLPYAQALAAGEAAVNLCLPGQNEVMHDLAALLVRPEIEVPVTENKLAVIDEQRCIGCTACIKACPVDAIIGSNKLMHTVLADECTGCALCLPPCPVDCIDMIATDAVYLPRQPLLSAHPQARFAAAEHAHKRSLAKTARTKKRARKAVQADAPATPDIAALLNRAKNRAAARANTRTAARSDSLQQEILTRQKSRAAYRNAQRDLRYGSEAERAAALAYLRQLKAAED